MRASRKDVRLRQGYGATVFALALRRERRLEARGFEPLTSSLQSWRSRCSGALVMPFYTGKHVLSRYPTLSELEALSVHKR